VLLAPIFAAMSNIRDKFILVGHAEGVSFLILLFIAMPLKYMADLPMAVRIVGSIHGFLFIVFVWMLWEAKKETGFSWLVAAKAFLLALIPFGTFFLKNVVQKNSGETKTVNAR
jgi:integral membrane protein